LPIGRAVFCAVLIALSLAGCSGGPLREDVITQARPDGRVAFDVVKIDDAVLTTLQARKRPGFARRFRHYHPPPRLRIAVGDTLSVVVWESGDDGLFGTSLTELSFPAGAAAAAGLGRGPSLEGTPSRPGGMTASPDLLASLFGGAAGQAGAETTGQAGFGAAEQGSGGFALAKPGEAGAAWQSTPGGSRRPAETSSNDLGAMPQARTSDVERLLEVAIESGRAGTRIPDQAVGPDGAISIPYAGRIAVAGRTPAEVERTIRHALAHKALDPQALVIVRQSAANSVAVAGEAIGGKRVQLSPGGDRLLQVIAAAGGEHAPVHDILVRLSRGGVTATVPLATLVAEPRQDIFAEPGDVVTLVRRPRTFSVFGASGRNAAITFTSDRMSLAEALAKSGGLRDDRADPRAVFLFRYEPVNVVRALGQPIASDARGGLSPIVYRLDLKAARSYLLASRFPVEDKDVIFVADAETQPLYHFFQVLSLLSGPVVGGLVACHATGC